MTTTKLGFVMLLLCGTVLLGFASAQEGRPCPLNCDPKAEYMICPMKSVAMRLTGQMCENCCTAQSRGCMLYDENGSVLCNEERTSSFHKVKTVVERANGKGESAGICPLYCDQKADSMICKTESKIMKITGTMLCENCCTAQSLGCMLYDENGSPICNEEQSVFTH